MSPSSKHAMGFILLMGWITALPAADYLRDVKPVLQEHCYGCHGPEKQKSGLRVDTVAALTRGGDNGRALSPGGGAESLLVKVLLGESGDLDRMPLKKPPLQFAQIALIREWIDEGAKAPEAEEAARPSPAHWAFLAPERPAVPEVRNVAWPAGSIDRLILARLEAEGIEPSPPADPITLIRRVSLDLTGLPPSIKEVAEFAADTRPDAYERVVDRLLRSKHHGERWGRHWLDAARYADSSGYSIDGPRSIWKYRDWVVNALNDDMPFDQFTIEQLAGDLLPEPTLDQRVATGFHRNTQINQEGGVDEEQFRVESIFDRVNTTGAVWLGLTVGCAQCHSHKFDPISQREYYGLFAFFNNCDEPQIELASESELRERDHARRRIKELEAALKQDPGKIPDGDLAGLKSELGRARKQDRKFPTSMVVAERAQPRESYLFVKGDFTRPADRVTPAVPAVLHPLKKEGEGNRLDLALWLMDPQNPLTARVTVNRLWQAYFGRGLVETEEDFGTQGTPPSHPELLDWLATEFIRRGWSLKAMHRLIVTSATYRQSSRVRPGLMEIDPSNRLLARQSRLRLDAEIVRDVALSASGLLSTKVGGPGVHPPQPDGVMGLGQVNREWKADTGEDRYRRGMYTYYWRATPHPALAVFDAPSSFAACTRRIRSNTPLQALTLLNDAAFVEMASALTGRVLQEGPPGDRERIDYAVRLCLARPPGGEETGRLLELLALERSLHSGSPDQETLAWTTLSRVLLNLDETITRE